MTGLPADPTQTYCRGKTQSRCEYGDHRKQVPQKNSLMGWGRGKRGGFCSILADTEGCGGCFVTCKKQVTNSRNGIIP